MSANAVEGGVVSGFAIGGGFEIAADGVIGPIGQTAQKSIGLVLGTGSRASQGGLTDQFAGDYIVVKLGK